ncbi:MAG: M23 family metallopeptidase [Alphaproteobacteria bacterium]|nr:M23 family metallopeptidase [Alphaproteobacteria bacterium]
MDRRNEPTQIAFEPDWQRPQEATATIPNLEGRWALVSTSLSALIVGSIAWLAVGTMTPVDTAARDTSRGFLPYELFQQLARSGSALFADTDQNTARVRAPDQLDRRLAVERAGRPEIETHTITLDSGDTLAGALENAGVAASDATAVITALARVYNPRNIRAGQTLDLTYHTPAVPASGAYNLTNTTSDDDTGGDIASAEPVAADPISRLLSLKFSPSVEHDITVTRAADGSFVANDVTKQLVAHVHRAGATIDSSLYLSAMRAGIPTDVVGEMIKMFSYKVDFQRDLHPGDSFEVYYDYYYTPEGQPAKQGSISYAMMRLGGKQIALYRYQPDPNQPADYFDAKGQSAKGMLMKTPVDGARITSGFGMRFHPILGYSRMHKGVDFGVPIGTPVMAAGSGRIAFMGWESGYGKFVLVNHGNGYSTAYGHLSRFAPGLHVGSGVRQAQIIAYSGMTGMATGPHLHYEIRINNVQVNPLKVRIAQGRVLSGAELRQFQSERMRIDNQIVATKLETKVADASGDIRKAN